LVAAERKDQKDCRDCKDEGSLDIAEYLAEGPMGLVGQMAGLRWPGTRAKRIAPIPSHGRLGCSGRCEGVAALGRGERTWRRTCFGERRVVE
jgi:hypothetical protein